MLFYMSHLSLIPGFSHLPPFSELRWRGHNNRAFSTVHLYTTRALAKIGSVDDDMVCRMGTPGSQHPMTSQAQMLDINHAVLHNA